MRIKNLVYAIIIIVLVTILFAQVRQLGYIAGAMIQEKEIKIHSTFSAPDTFENWETLSNFERIIVYFSGYLLVVLVWFIVTILLPPSSSGLVICARIWSSILILIYQLWSLISISSVFFTPTGFGRAGYANAQYGNHPIMAFFIILIILLISVFSVWKRRPQKAHIENVTTHQIIFYKEFNILGSILVGVLVFSLILTSLRTRPLELFNLDFGFGKIGEEIFILQADSLVEDLFSFELDKKQRIYLTIKLNNIDSEYLNLGIKSDSFSQTILEEDNLKTEERIIEVEMNLDAGTYFINFTNFNKIINKTSISLSLNIY